MTQYDPKTHHRRSIRLRGYDYRQAGAYFVTIVTHDRALLFDDPVLRGVAETAWQRIPAFFPFVELDQWVLMPNHLHGILIFHTGAPDRGLAPPDPAGAGEGAPENAAPSGSLGAVVGNFKSVTARRINRVRRMPGARVWQRNYYDRVIRNEREFGAIRQYIHDNPANWAQDQEHPDRLR